MVPITRPTAISLIRSGEIRGKRIGRGWFIPQSEVDRLTNT
ncbi:helix-turn-helix domain-containing protein [Gordonia jinhuaensis]